MKKHLLPWHIVAAFALAKILIHAFTFDNLELHRDAYLYFAQSEHLAWGYIAVPPMIALVGKVATTLFGDTTFALRLFPALIGTVNIILIGLSVKELGGKRMAVTLACAAYLLSPSFLHTNALFQPVSFNQFFWVLSSYLFLRMINRQEPQVWIWIGCSLGIGFLNKYSIAFFALASVLGLLLTPQRRLFISKYFLVAIGLGVLIVLPNLIWQYNHNWPVLFHMEELRARQLIHVEPIDFIVGQLMMNMQAILLWLPAVLVLLLLRKERKYRPFGFTYLIVFLLLLLGSGKAYYALGIYPILFAFGAFFFEKYVRKFQPFLFGYLLFFMAFSFYISLRFDGVPFVTFEDVYQKGGYTWEDGQQYDVPQDMADMTGWTELAETVKSVYLGLSDSARQKTDIFCYHYGQAGAIMFHDDGQLPPPICENGSFIFWAPDSISSERIIWVHTDLGSDFNPEKELPKRFENVSLRATIKNEFFRENNTRIYLCERPTPFWKDMMKSELNELKERYSR